VLNQYGCEVKTACVSWGGREWRTQIKPSH